MANTTTIRLSCINLWNQLFYFTINTQIIFIYTGAKATIYGHSIDGRFNRGSDRYRILLSLSHYLQMLHSAFFMRCSGGFASTRTS